METPRSPRGAFRRAPKKTPKEPQRRPKGAPDEPQRSFGLSRSSSGQRRNPDDSLSISSFQLQKTTMGPHQSGWVGLSLSFATLSWSTSSTDEDLLTLYDQLIIKTFNHKRSRLLFPATIHKSSVTHGSGVSSESPQSGERSSARVEDDHQEQESCPEQMLHLLLLRRPEAAAGAHQEVKKVEGLEPVLDLEQVMF